MWKCVALWRVCISCREVLFTHRLHRSPVCPHSALLVLHFTSCVLLRVQSCVYLWTSMAVLFALGSTSPLQPAV